MKSTQTVLVVLALAFLSGCSAPNFLVHKGAGQLRYDAAMALDKAALVGQGVYIGGTILSITQEAGQSRVEIANRLLNAQGYPEKGTEDINKRAMILVQGFSWYDYRPGDRFAAVGTVLDKSDLTIGGASLSVLLVQAEDYRVWQQSPYLERARFDYDYGYGYGLYRPYHYY